ncbi:MAG: PD40 domain-containing protein [Planctomycetes bacterium]|nr:PD40 domain-containing protein [Planctomycetota bacterium]
MENYLTQITNYLLTQSWQIAVLVAVIAAATVALKNRSAHVRYLLWLIVLAKCLVPPLLTVPLAVLPQDKPVPVFEIAVMPKVEPLPLPSTPVPPAPTRTVAARPARLSPRQWLGLAWIVGVATFVLVAMTKALRTQFWLRGKRKPLPAEMRTGIEDLFSGLELKTFPKAWLIEGIGQPFVWGLLHGSIYLPANFVKVNNVEHRRGVLGHELGHVLRFDAVVNLLQVISQAVFWFHPFVWWANKRIRAEREKCCDEMAIARLGAKAKDYSRAIVDTLVAEYKSTRPVPSLAVAGPVKNIEERIKTMMRPGKKFYKHPSLPVVAVVFLTALLAVPTTVVLTTAADNQPTTESADEDRTFGNPTNLGPTVNSSANEYDPSISPDELELYFNSYRPGGFGNADIWVTRRKTKVDPWDTPVNLGPTVNSSAHDYAPSISVDGLSLYFSSKRPGGYGDQDIWVTTRKTKGDPWGTPVNLGPIVNSSGFEEAPSISADGLTLYFTSRRPGGYGNGDLWVTTRKTKADLWGTPVNLGSIINGSDWELNPDISADGSILYFASNRPGAIGGSGNFDIWQVSLKEHGAKE